MRADDATARARAWPRKIQAHVHLPSSFRTGVAASVFLHSPASTVLSSHVISLNAVFPPPPLFMLLSPRLNEPRRTCS